MGPAGPQGPTGPKGAQGPQGFQGIQGPVGPSGVVATVFASGLGANSMSNTLQFLVPPVTVSITQAGQTVFVSSQKSMGSTEAGGADSLDLWICYKPSAAAAPTKLGSSGIYNQRVPQNTRIPFAMSAVIQNLAVGTYSVGMCGSVTAAGGNPADWNTFEYGLTSAIIAKP